MSFSLPERLWEEAPVTIGTLVKKNAADEERLLKMGRSLDGGRQNDGINTVTAVDIYTLCLRR